MQKGAYTLLLFHSNIGEFDRSFPLAAAAVALARPELSHKLSGPCIRQHSTVSKQEGRDGASVTQHNTTTSQYDDDDDYNNDSVATIQRAIEPARLSDRWLLTTVATVLLTWPQPPH